MRVVMRVSHNLITQSTSPPKQLTAVEGFADWCANLLVQKGPRGYSRCDMPAVLLRALLQQGRFVYLVSVPQAEGWYWCSHQNRGLSPLPIFFFFSLFSLRLHLCFRLSLCLLCLCLLVLFVHCYRFSTYPVHFICTYPHTCLHFYIMQACAHKYTQMHLHISICT